MEGLSKPKTVTFRKYPFEYYYPEFTIEEPDFGEAFETLRRVVVDAQVKAIDTLDQKMVEACIQAAQEEGVCLTLIDKKFIADAIREKMEREGLMDEQLTTGDDD